MISFTEQTLPSYRAARHHHEIAVALEDVALGRCDRLMIFEPPRHGKSELASRRFPAWYVGKFPERQLIAASYNSDLAGDFGRDVRNIVASGEYRGIFSTRLAADSQAANRWHTDRGGMYAAAGVGTAITGRGADVFLIDDPIKDREEADSEVARRRVWDWYRSVAYTRLMPGAAIVLVQTRWHEDDLAGRLLADMEGSGDKWRVISLPAINDDGEALWPEWYPAERLFQIKAVIGERDWSALYQQRPTPDTGDYFKREWLRYYDEPPRLETLRIYGASDYAAKPDTGDFTVHGVVGVDPDDNLYVLDWWRGRTDSATWSDVLVSLIGRWRPVEWLEEAGPIAKAVGPFLDVRQCEAGAYCVRRQLPSVTDKPTRAQAIRGRAAQGKLYLPKNEPWTIDLVAGMMMFPAGKVDDDVDVLSLFGRAVDSMHRPRWQPVNYVPRGIV